MTSDRTSRDVSVRHQLQPLRKWLDDPSVSEIWINKPGQVIVESNSRRETFDVAELDYDSLESMATAIARYAGDTIGETKPILSALLPDGERIQIVMPPACTVGTISMTIRRPSSKRFSLSDYSSSGFFKKIIPVEPGLSDLDKSLTNLIQKKEYEEFLVNSVTAGKNIVVAGGTGSGKTTFMKALIDEIPLYERLITIEDVPELFLPNHDNHVHLFYPSEASEEKNDIVTSASLLKSCLRMKPDRILPAELRGGETFDFVNVCSSGHGGSITSCHAGSSTETFERLALMVLQNRQGRTLPYDVIKNLLFSVVDIVVHVHNDPAGIDGRHITEIWFDPARKKH